MTPGVSHFTILYNPRPAAAAPAVTSRLGGALFKSRLAIGRSTAAGRIGGMKHLILTYALLFAIPAIIALAAEIDGVWKAQMPGFAGLRDRTVVFQFNADGEKLSGVVTGFHKDEIGISKGKVSGEYISFAVNTEFDGNTVRLLYVGKVSGNSIRFLIRPEGATNTGDFAAQRIS